MRHSYFGKKLSRSQNERKRLLRNLVRDVILKDVIETTLAKAKAVQPWIEKLITKAKRGNGADLYQIRQVLNDGVVMRKLLAEAKSRFDKRISGYSRIIKLGKREGDAAEIVQLGFVDAAVVSGEVVEPAKVKSK